MKYFKLRLFYKVIYVKNQKPKNFHQTNERRFAFLELLTEPKITVLRMEREHGAHYKSSGGDPRLHCVHSIIRLPSPFLGHVTSIVTNQRPVSGSRDQY